MRKLTSVVKRSSFIATTLVSLVLLITFQAINLYNGTLDKQTSPLRGGKYSTLVTFAPAHEKARRHIPIYEVTANASSDPSMLLKPNAELSALQRRVKMRKEALAAKIQSDQERISVSSKLSRFVKKSLAIQVNEVEHGEVEPPADVAEAYKLHTVYAKYTPEELLERYRYMDIVYTWVNGSEANHLFKKHYRRNTFQMVTRPTDAATNGTGALLSNNNGTEGNVSMSDQRGSAWIPLEAGHELLDGHRLISFLEAMRHRQVNSRDRESDELRYSVRSLDQFVEWHHGRIIIVAPGHCPQWLDVARNFFARSRRPLAHLRRRIVAVHQDSIVPGNQRLTFNTNTIEQHIHKLANLSDLFVQFNDDYFVNHNTTVSDFVNSYGGAILLHEGGEVRGAQLAYRTIKKIWLGGVYHSNSFNIRELEEVPAKYVPRYVAANVKERRRRAGRPLISSLEMALRDGGSSLTAVAAAANGDGAVREIRVGRKLMEAQIPVKSQLKLGGHRPIARILDPNGNEMQEQRPKRKRYFLKHAPFVYCKRMFQHLSERYERDFAGPALRNPHRNKEDLLLPFIHNAFVVDRPWAGSPEYLPHVIAVNENISFHNAQVQNGTITRPLVVTPLTIALDNSDGCAPVENRIGEAARSLLVIIINDMEENKRRIEHLRATDPVFFALNDGFSNLEVQKQLQGFMAEKYPFPSLYEQPAPGHTSHHQLAVAAVEGNNSVVLEDITTSEAAPLNCSRQPQPATLDDVYHDLMQLPIVILTSEHHVIHDVVCPLLRSLRLCLPSHSGDVVVRNVATGNRLSTPIVEEGDAVNDIPPRLFTSCLFNQTKVKILSEEEVRETTDRSLRHPSPHDLADFTLQAAIAAKRRKMTTEMGCSYAPPVVLQRSLVELLPISYGPEASVRGFVFDMRRDVEDELPYLSVPGQTLALEDFTLLPSTERVLDGSPSSRHASSSWLYLSPSPRRMREASESRMHFGQQVVESRVEGQFSVNWVKGVSTRHLLFSFPVPYSRYERMDDIQFKFE